MKCKAILFDMDGVIVDSMQWHAESWIKVFSDMGIVLTKHDIFKREGMSGLDSIVDIIKEKGYPEPGVEEQKNLQKKKVEIFDRKKVYIFPEVKKILTFIKSKNIKTGIVTGSLRRTVDSILPDDIRHLLDTIITADDIHNGKPHPEPYLKAMSILNASPDSTLVIENAPLGIASAKSAGAECFAVQTTLPVEFLLQADMVFKTHKDLLDYLLTEL